MIKQYREGITFKSLETIYGDVEEELKKAHSKHPEFPTDPVHAVAVMAEEAGEAVRASLQLYYEKGTAEELRKELIQTAAMCVRTIDGLDSGRISSKHCVCRDCGAVADSTLAFSTGWKRTPEGGAQCPICAGGTR